jgi:hypothetical protein
MKYLTIKKLNKIKDKLIDILLFPVRCVCTPVYKLIQKKKENMRYSEKQIEKVVQYLIDYWTDNQEEFYIIMDVNYNPFDYNNVKTPYGMQSDMSWGWNGENRRIKNKARHIWCYQQEQYLNIFKKLCGTPMSLEEKKNWFDDFDLYKLKDRAIYKLN